MKFFLSFLILLFSLNLYAGKPHNIPDCLDGKKAIPVNSERIAEFKRSSKDQFKARGHIQGEIAAVYHTSGGHDHFQVIMNDQSQTTIEVIYNNSFGKLPALSAGALVQACGDYITARKIRPSPDEAILHWVHRSNKPKSHESGFVAIDGEVYGY